MSQSPRDTPTIPVPPPPTKPFPPKRPRQNGNYSKINPVAIWERERKRAAKQQSTDELSVLQEVFNEAETEQYEQQLEGNYEFETPEHGPLLQEIFAEAESESYYQEFEEPTPDSEKWARSQAVTRREGNGQPDTEPPPAQRPQQLQGGRANAPWGKEEQLPLPFDDDEEPVTMPLPDRAPPTQRSPGNAPPSSRRTAVTRRDLPPMPPPSSGSASTNRMQSPPSSGSAPTNRMQPPPSSGSAPTNRMQPPPAAQSRNQRPVQSPAKPAPQRQAPPPKAPPRQQTQRQPPKPPKPQQPPQRPPKGKKRELEISLIEEIFLEQEAYPID